MPWSKDNNNNNEKNKNKKDENVWGDGGGSGSGNKNNKKKSKMGSSSGGGSSTTTSNSNLGGVSGIMDSLENFKTAQQVGKMTNSLVQELASTTVEGVAADGKVKVYFDGQQQPLGVQIDETYFKQQAGVESPSAEDLSAAVTSAMKDAYQKSSDKMDEKMKSFYVELGLK